MRRRDEKRLRPVRPNAGSEALYRRRLRRMVGAMHKSILHWVAAAWRKDTPLMAQDSPAEELARAVRGLGYIWRGKFEEAAQHLARHFAEDIEKRSSAALRRILEDGGFSVRFRMTPPMRDVLAATTEANVSLIRSIPEKYLGEVEGAVMRSAQAGRDLEALTKDIRGAYGVTRKRAAFIARDQTNKATSAMTAARQREAGIEVGIWRHSHAGKEARPTHVKMDGKRFDLGKGMYDSAEREWVMPGQLINCRCGWSPVIEGLRA